MTEEPTKELVGMEEKKKEIIKNTKHNYQKIEKSIVEQLFMKQDLHGTTIGTEREDTWQELFEMIIPRKFVVEHSVFIIDSGKGVSREVDLAIIDEMYTPYIFRYGRIKFIPIEAVAVVVECKSNISDKENIKKWCERIEALKTDTRSIARTATSIAFNGVPTQKSTRPIKILCSLSKIDKDIQEKFDFTLQACQKVKGKSDPAHIKCIVSEEKDLNVWNRELNFHGFELEKYEKEDIRDYADLKMKSLSDLQIKECSIESNSLLTFNFQLNQLLMLINNPILFPHQAYVDMFNGVERSDT